MNCDHTVRDHLHQAHESARKAARTAADDLGQRLVSDDVRTHLRSAARSMLHAGLAVIDAAEARRAARQPVAPAHASETPPAT